MDYSQKSLELHKILQGKIETKLKTEIRNTDDLSTVYSPGVAAPCKEIAKNTEEVYTYTMKGNTVAVVSDGSAVLGLGNIGAEASLPVMEGKCALFKTFGGVNAVPIVLDTQDTEEIIQTIERIAPAFGGINLEDISAPRCFEIETRLKKKLDIPVFHDDQHGTAIVCLAGLINALKIVNKEKQNVRVVINGVGAAGVAITKLLLLYGFNNILVVDSRGIIHEGRVHLNNEKQELAALTNINNLQGNLVDAVKDTDIFLGVSAPGVLTKEMVQSMNTDAIIFAMANPTPEIMPELAYEAGAAIVATGRSDYPNQINNSLVFPGIFKGALQARVRDISDTMKIQAAESLAACVQNPNIEKIIPGPFEAGVVDAIANSIK